MAYLRRIRFSILLAALIGTTPAGATPPGYFVDSTQASAERPRNLVVSDGDFTLSIQRSYYSRLEERIMGIAEATYPSRDSLLVLAIERANEIGSDSARTPLWWCDGLGVSRVPYAVTAGALEHYMKLTESFRSHNFRGAWTRNLFWTDLSYRASIAPRDEYHFQGGSVANVYVAE